MKKYVCLIIDIERSKSYENRERNEMQHYMDECVKNLNELFDYEMECEVTFSAGDELQGLFDNVTTSLLYFRLLEMLMKPVGLRAGIGVGDWTVKMEKGLSTQQDGPAYHNARQAILEVHDMQLHNVRVCSDMDDSLVNHLVNASLFLKRQQVYMQNIVHVIVELLFPFVHEKIRIRKYDDIKRLLDIKFHYGLGVPNKDRYMREKNRRNIEYLDLENTSKLIPIYIDGIMSDTESIVIRKNTASNIAGILKCTRQNVDTIMRRGCINKIRELDFVALQYVEKYYGGNEWN